MTDQQLSALRRYGASCVARCAARGVACDGSCRVEPETPDVPVVARGLDAIQNTAGAPSSDFEGATE